MIFLNLYLLVSTSQILPFITQVCFPGINVSRNPSDASEKSAPEPREAEPAREPSADRARETEIAPERDGDDDKKDELLEREDKHV